MEYLIELLESFGFSKLQSGATLHYKTFKVKHSESLVIFKATEEYTITCLSDDTYEISCNVLNTLDELYVDSNILLELDDIEVLLIKNIGD